MAENHTEGPVPSAAPSPGDHASGPLGAGEPESPEVRDARTAVERAQEELRRAQEVYEDLRRDAVTQLKRIREQTVGELVESGLAFVRKHPGPGVVLGAIVGFILGRFFRR